jgi:hypothetical protein
MVDHAGATASMAPGEAADVVYVWSVLDPLFGTLLLPFDLRSRCQPVSSTMTPLVQSVSHLLGRPPTAW